MSYANAHSYTTVDHLTFEVFCKAIPTVSYANALTLPEQAIATLVTTQRQSVGKL
ncbi:MAG: hypothetical protein V7L00_27155 [Nostoc sp.]|uniref:hypothetical protein n=1 Tax=Nostoc sp. TaxID=1180 RepID=UPI002FF5E8BE